jgi:hypothetical protein
MSRSVSTRTRNAHGYLSARHPLVDREIPSSLRGDLGAEFPETVRDFNPVMILGEPR